MIKQVLQKYTQLLIISLNTKLSLNTKSCITYSGLELQPGAAGFQLSNPPMLETISLLASLNVSVVVTVTMATTNPKSSGKNPVAIDTCHAHINEICVYVH